LADVPIWKVSEQRIDSQQSVPELKDFLKDKSGLKTAIKALFALSYE
jgi:hypothetical protein